MATPTVVSKQGGQKPSDTAYPSNADAVQGLRITLTLIGTSANLVTDFATLIAQSFASTSATLTWERT